MLPNQNDQKASQMMFIFLTKNLVLCVASHVARLTEFQASLLSTISELYM